MAFLAFLIVAALVTYRSTTPEQRQQVPRVAGAWVAAFVHRRRREIESFHTALLKRMPHAFVTAALVVLTIVAFFATAGRGHDAAALVGAGASLGTRTTHGEWWRLLTANLVQTGFLMLIVNIAALAQAGAVVERLVGRAAFAATVAAAAVLSQLTTIAFHPLEVSAGASGAVMGLYGLLAVTIVTGRLHQSDVTVPNAALKQFAVVFAVFLLANLADHVSHAGGDVVGLLVGIVFGVVFARDVSAGPAPRRPVWMAAGGAALVAIVAAIPLRNILDVKPELQRLVDIEQRTSSTYDAAEAKMRKRAITTDALARVIDTAIVPALEAADARVAGLSRVAAEDRGRVADARAYLRLRIESWKLRAQSLRDSVAPAVQTPRVEPGADPAAVLRASAQARHRSNSLVRGRAEAAEREALETLNRIAPGTF